MYNALRVGFVSVGLWMVVRVMARFRLGFRSLVCHSESLGEWVAGVEVIGGRVGEWVAVNGIRLWCSICLGRPAFDCGSYWGDVEVCHSGLGSVGRCLLRVLVGVVVGLVMGSS